MQHPGPYYEPRKTRCRYADRVRAEAEARHAELDCKCAVCLLYGPAYCPGDSRTYRPLERSNRHETPAPRCSIEGQRQLLIAAQVVTKAKAAGHDAQRIERAAALVNADGAGPRQRPLPNIGATHRRLPVSRRQARPGIPQV